MYDILHLQRSRRHSRADGSSDIGQALLPLGEEFGFVDDDLLQIAVLDLGPVGLGRGGEPRRDGDSILCELRHHLAQRRVLPADGTNVGGTELVEPLDERRCGLEFF